MTPRRIDVSTNHAKRLAAEIADETAKRSAIGMYFGWYENYPTTAQLYAGTDLGNTVASTAMLFLVAADAEDANPEPSKVRDCACLECRWYRLFGPKDVPAIECEPV